MTEEKMPFIAVGNDELSDIPCKKGDIAAFTHDDGTEEECEVKYGINTQTKEEDPVISFITLQNGKTYLVGINGKFMFNKSIKMKEN